MVRNLKMMLLAGMALGAVGALGAGAAQASGEQYHCSVAPCKVLVNADGTGKTAHFVFDYSVNGGNLTTTTCPFFTGHATQNTATTTELTVTEISLGAVGACSVGGQPATMDVNGCHFLLTAGTEGTLHLQCPAGKAIQDTFGACTVSVGPQTLSGVKYHNVGTEITVEMLIKNIHGTTTAGCPGGAGTFTTGEITTGNLLFTGQTDPGGVMATIFYE
jgi:hypothetical protein